MTETAAPTRRMTVDEFMEWAETQEEPYELVDGVPVPLWPRDPAQPKMMAPPSRRHQRIVRNIELALVSRVPPPCWVAAGIGVRLEDERSRVPDVLAACVEHDEAANLVDEPALLVEVLSPRNEDIDRTVKLDEYKALPSVQEIWLVASTRRWAQIWRREAGTWVGVDLIGRGTIESAWLRSEVPLDELYAGVSL